MKRFILLILISSGLFFCNCVYAQAYKVIELTAKVIDKKTGAAVQFANVRNIKKRRSVVTDSAGIFRIVALQSDIIKITSIGYKTKYINFQDSIFDPLRIYKIELEEQTYELSKINIFESRWKDLIFEVSHTEFEKEETTERIDNWMASLFLPHELAMITAANSVGIPITYTTKLEKQKQKVEELSQEELNKKIIHMKYNEEIVSMATGLKDKKLEKFMRFCNFKEHFLLNSTEYEIIQEIKKRFKAYKAKGLY